MYLCQLYYCVMCYQILRARMQDLIMFCLELPLISTCRTNHLAWKLLQNLFGCAIRISHLIMSSYSCLLVSPEFCSNLFLYICSQDPLRGGRDPLVEDVLSVIHADDAIACEKIALAPNPRRLVFEWQLQLARRISPFQQIVAVHTLIFCCFFPVRFFFPRL